MQSGHSARISTSKMHQPFILPCDVADDLGLQERNPGK